MAKLPCTTGQTVHVATGTVPGTYTLEYTATVDSDATGTINNVVVPTGDPIRAARRWAVARPITRWAIRTSRPRSWNPARVRTTVIAGRSITYTPSATASDAATTALTSLTDTLCSGHTLTVPGRLVHDRQTVVCTLPTGTVPGTYTFEHRDGWWRRDERHDQQRGRPGAVVAIRIRAARRWAVARPITRWAIRNITASKSSNPASGTTVIVARRSPTR
ncbi:hypothetical protein [Dokdonella sp.]|uniref:hypothetical protein n=1 Tax=Dokdonella sp. TaxID=2291710 RepID=UPI003527ADF5